MVSSLFLLGATPITNRSPKESQSSIMDKSIPKQVNISVKLLYSSLIIGIIRMLINIIQQPEANNTLIPTIIISAFTFGIAFFFIYMIAQRANWARMIYLIFFIIGIPITILILIGYQDQSRVSAIFMLCQAVLQLIAIIFLFKGESSVWFKKDMNPTTYKSNR